MRAGMTLWTCSLLVWAVGCATTNTPVAAPPLAEDLTWSAPVPVAPAVPEPTTSQGQSEPLRARSGKEKVYAYEAGGTYRIDVSVGAPMDIVLQSGEEIYNLADGDRAPVEGQEQGRRWEIQQAYSGSGAQGRPHIMITVPAAGLTNGVTITTTKRTYYLDCRSVGKTTVRSVRWTYADEPAVQAKATPRLWPDPARPQRYHVPYMIETSTPTPVWTPRQAIDDGQKTYILFPPTVMTVDAPLVRLIGPVGPELVNARQSGSVLIIDRLFTRAELRLGTGKTAEVVIVQRLAPRTIECPGDHNCPVWPDALARSLP